MAKEVSRLLFGGLIVDKKDRGGVRPFFLFSKVGQVGSEVLEHLAAALEALAADEG